MICSNLQLHDSLPFEIEEKPTKILQMFLDSLDDVVDGILHILFVNSVKKNIKKIVAHLFCKMYCN